MEDLHSVVDTPSLNNLFWVFFPFIKKKITKFVLNYILSIYFITLNFYFFFLVVFTTANRAITPLINGLNGVIYLFDYF